MCGIITVGGDCVIIAVDFDGVLVQNAFPKIGEPDYEMVDLVRLLIQKSGVEVILWTSRVDQPLEDAVSWCKWLGLRFDAINDNAPSNKRKYGKLYPNGTRKVYADYYLDDHNMGYNRQTVISIIKSILREGEVK
jgi:hypothetical protein